MARFGVIVFSAVFGVAFFFWFSRSLRKPAMKRFILSNQWLLHPNAICYWRTGMAFVGLLFYFFTPYQPLAIFIFTFAAILDGVDGRVARECDLGSTWGEWLDPMCDKLTYLPPLFGFAQAGIISMKLLWILTAIELFGQFFARKVLSWMKISGAANNFGKIKAIICFGLVILCALMDANPEMIDIADGVLMACIILGTASVVFKFVPNRLYADILSLLNFCCGVTSLILTHNRFFAWAIFVIIMGQLFDLFDGRMAIKHGGTKYGPYLDDIADFVSFGMAPSYVVIQKGGALCHIVAGIFIVGVAFRLIRFVVVDKKRTDLPVGIFNGLPSPAGSLIVLGAALVASPPVLWLMTLMSTALMVSHIRFAHFGRVILKETPKPVFFMICAAISITIAFLLKTKNAQVFGYLVLVSAVAYVFIGRKLVNRQPL